MSQSGDRSVLLFESVPLPSAERGCLEVSERIGGLVRAIPDGETGERLKRLARQRQRLTELDVEMIGTREFGCANEAASPYNTHMPVPRDRVDDAFFTPVDDFALVLEIQLDLGVVHLPDGVEVRA